MDDDPNNLKYQLIDSIKDTVSNDVEFFYKDGKIIAEKYKYSITSYTKQY